MTKRRGIPTAPEPLEAYARHFDDLFGKSNQRDEFRRYLEGLLLPTERNKTLTGLANTEPYVGAQHPRAQGMQWFLSEASWQEKQVQERRLQVLFEEPSTAPNGQGVLVIDEHGDRKRGQKTAHSGRQYLANVGKTDNGVVSVTSLWADEDVYYPLDFEPYTPADYFAEGKQDPAFRTKLKIALQLVQRAVQAHISFRAVVADNFYGEDCEFRQGLRDLHVGYVLALKPSHAWWHPKAEISSFQAAAKAAGWMRAEHKGSLGQSDTNVSRWLVARLVGPGTEHPSLWTRQTGTSDRRHHRSGHLARTDYLLPHHQSPCSPIAARTRQRVCCGQRGGSCAPVWTTHVGRAELQAGEIRSGLVRVPGQK
jgi:SRSO17 transposase